MPKVYSFDVYDTCISRIYARPRDLFFDIGDKLACRLEMTAHRLPISRDFRKLRIEATRIAHKQCKPRESATLEEIYSHLKVPPAWEIAASEIMQIELDLEGRHVFPVKRTLNELNILRQRGHSIIFISDMYLPEYFIRALLMRHGFFQEGDRLYVSSEVGLSKKSGHLFTHVLKTENLSPNELCHIGDNPVADLARPLALGIEAIDYRMADFSRREALAVTTIDKYGLPASIISGASRLGRLSNSDDSSHEDVRNEITSAVIAPFLTSYVSWLLAKSVNDGIERLYFVARDGQILLKIAQQLSHYQKAPELRYLYGSRRAWLAASLDFSDNGWQRLIAVPGQKNTPADFLGRLGFDTSQWPELIRMMGYDTAFLHRHLKQREISEFLAKLPENRAINAMLIQHIEQSRRTALGYFSQEGMLEPVPWAIVDTGWRLNCQAMLKRILSHAQPAISNVHGYYLTLSKDRIDHISAGTTSAFLDSNPALLRRRVMFEHVFTPATHASTTGYMESGHKYSPVIGMSQLSLDETDRIEKQHALICNVTEAIAKHGIIYSHPDDFRSAALKQVERFILNPSREEAELLSTIGTHTDLRHEWDFQTPLCRPLSPQDVYTMMRQATMPDQRYRARISPWIEGSVAMSPAYLRIPFNLLLSAAEWLRSVLRNLDK